MTSAAWWVTRIPGARPGHPIKTQKEAHKKKQRGEGKRAPRQQADYCLQIEMQKTGSF